MGDFGIKAAQKGYNVRSCADWELLFSSKWKFWQIVQSGTVEISDKTADQVIYEHNLGYYPAFYVFDITDGSSKSTELAQYVGSGENDFKWLGSTLSSPAGSCTLKYFIFTHSLLDEITATLNFDTETSREIDSNFGFKATYAGYDITDTDMRHFTFHTSCKGLQVYRSKVYTAAVLVSQYMHYLGYEPFMLTYFKPSSISYFRIVQAGDQQIRAWSDTTNVYLVSTAPGTTSSIVFSDPFTLGGI